MSDLTEILKMQWEAYPNALKTGQDAQANAIALENARRAQQEREGLKALYAQQANPSYQAIGAISPEYAQTAMKNQLEMQQAMTGMSHQQAETAKILNAEDREKEALMSKAALPYLNAYEANKGKIPDAENHHKLMTALSDIANQAVAGNWAPSHYTSMNPNATFESILSNVNKSGVFTDSQRLSQEAAKARGSQEGLVQGGVPMTPQMYHGSVELDEVTGLPIIRPSLRGIQPPDANATPADPANIKKLTFYEDMLKAPDATAEEQAFAEAQIIKLSPKENFKAQPQAVINTPEQITAKKAELKGEIAEAEKAATLSAEEKAADRKAIENYFRGPKPQAVRNLIKESIEGDVQSGLARLGKFFGVAVPGGDALAALKVIEQQMARSLPYAPGNASDIDVRNRLEMISSPATDEPIVNRLRALEEVIRDAEAYVVQKGELSEDQILDAVANGYLSESSAVEMINKGMKTSTGVK